MEELILRKHRFSVSCSIWGIYFFSRMESWVGAIELFSSSLPNAISNSLNTSLMQGHPFDKEAFFVTYP